MAWEGGNIYAQQKETFLGVSQKKRNWLFFLCLNTPFFRKSCWKRLKSSDSPSITLVFTQHFCSIQSFPQNQMLLMALIRLCHHCPVENYFFSVLLNSLLFFLFQELSFGENFIWPIASSFCCPAMENTQASFFL